MADLRRHFGSSESCARARVRYRATSCTVTKGATLHTFVLAAWGTKAKTKHVQEKTCCLALPPKAARPNNHLFFENVWFGLGTPGLQKNTRLKNNFGIPLTTGFSIFKKMYWIHKIKQRSTARLFITAFVNYMLLKYHLTT